MLKRVIQSALSKFGYQLVRTRYAPRPAFGLDVLFPVLKDFGFAPKHIVDVGANWGNWTRGAIRYFPEAAYTLVEPQQHLRNHLRDLVEGGFKIRWIPTGAGDRPGTLPFTMASRDDSSSFAITEEEARRAGLPQIAVEVKTLNEIAASSNLPMPDMVKIDAEGFDLKVLSGASDLFGKTDIFLMEAAVCGGYENSVLRVIEHMAAAGYRLIDVTDLNRSPKFGVLWVCELAFLRNGSLLLDCVRSYE